MIKTFLKKLSKELDGELLVDNLTRVLYATDASVYRKMPLAVAYPKTEKDIQQLIQFANFLKIGIIPRTAGTSLAGQCVGDGIVVDVSKYFTKIGKLDFEKKQITVQPGVIRDELNRFLKPNGLFFGPNTSTANRCMIGGMVGNNSSGSTSIQYGVTRDKVVEIKGYLSDGSKVLFKPLNEDELKMKIEEESLEGIIYKSVISELKQPEIQQNIANHFPKKQIHRRNTGYAVDALLENSIFSENTEEQFNISKLLAGSEGTLAFSTEITLQLDDLPPAHAAMVATHYTSIESCLTDVTSVMQHPLHLCEMMDKLILDLTKGNREQLKNRFFVEGDPEAILLLEVKANSAEELEQEVNALLKTIAHSGNSYAHPKLFDADIAKAIELRKAGLGILGSMVGDKKAVACIEDTAVALEDLKDFIGEFTAIMDSYNQRAVYYAHAGAGELHLRPILNLKNSEDVGLFRKITTDVAKLTKKYQGSFSGEHGDGIVRAEFIPLLLGEENYELFRRIKSYFDPNGIFNPGKIVDAYPMDESLRYEVDRKEPEISTLMDFSDSQGILRAAEQCNGSGDCRKTEHAKGGMCPSYQATKKEKDTTRARANALRDFLTNNSEQNAFNHQELKDVFDLCLSCKACASECPSNVDVAALKAEFLYQYQEANGYTFRGKMFANNTKMLAFGAKIPSVTNFFYNSGITSGILKKLIGINKHRNIPNVYNVDFNKVLENTVNQSSMNKEIVLFIDEFTKYLDVEIGKDAIAVLSKLGYKITLFYGDSGRSHLSKGFLKQAKQLANKNAAKLAPLLAKKLPIIGLEPSTILSFRDEYVRLIDHKDFIAPLKENSFLIEEFLSKEMEEGSISKEAFTKEAKTIKVHVHCHQKGLSNQKVTFDVLNFPENYTVSLIPSGCCGMAGSFGYEDEHYELSMQVGELKLFPAIRKAPKDVIIAANGTSCRHQIKDGTNREALHPISILRRALI